MNDDKIRISPDALIAMIVTEAQDRELARMPSLEEMNEDFQPSEKFQRKMEALVRDTKRKAERKKRLLNVKRFFITLTAAISIFSCTSCLSGTTKIDCTLVLYEKGLFGTYSEVSRSSSTYYGHTHEFSGTANIKSGTTYKLVTTATVTRNGSSETVSNTFEKKC